ncbi:hypothetical protein GRS96_18720 [Rathayibacter sp. VKM Ac-2803]|uniref:P-loop NTPase n=1 Tax=Rathayibacter sp. VKM Ac-2803 TaxID=2609256 RepID=UPI0013578CA0|nr:hypothetical protein [Rathayibacter sp. VKM Ac-2803]MWV51308.1 hypothetical protein [Rathayibacter sp. VKM Ac-2803]
MTRPDEANARLSDALSRLRQSLNLGAVAVVGAGLSIAARFPATAGLDALLYESLDEPPRSSSKTPPDDLQLWNSLAASRKARARFQTQFAAIDRDRSAVPSPAHEALARLIHAGVVETVVSLNWDTALERAYERLYGTRIPDGTLHKPHGDAANVNSDWIMPHQGGVVTAAVRARINELVNEHARTLVVVGYSESDEIIARELIGQLGRLWKTIRIGPSVTGENDVALTAEDALNRITADLLHAEEASSWHSVRFGGSRGFDAALAGERLGPSDVDACPELAEVDRVVSALNHQRAVVLNGQSGSGKSITAYQSLRKLAHSGYEVLRLRDNARDSSMASWLQDLNIFPQRKVLFIDDAQDVPADTVRELAEIATPGRLVLIVGVDQVAGGVTTVNISGVGAVAQIAHYIRTNSETVLPLVTGLDDQVGDHPGQTPLEFRLGAAERETSAWRFFYVLTGGWRRARRLALELREQNRADLALTAVAVAQIAGVDAGVTRLELRGLLSVLDRNEAWLMSALETLLSCRAIIESDDRLRCPHLQSAYHVVGWMLHPPSYDYTPPESAVVGAIASADEHVVPAARPSRREIRRAPVLPEAEVLSDQTITSAMIGYYLDLPSTPLRGCTWLIGRGLIGDSKWVLQYKTRLLDDVKWGELANRAIACPKDSTAEGAQLLTETMTWCPEVVRPILRNREESVSAWFRQLTPQNAWALGNLINVLHNHDYREHTEDSLRLASRVSPTRLATLLLEGGWGHIYSTSRGVERILTAASVELRAAAAAELDRVSYQEFLGAKHDDLDAIVALIKAVAAIDYAYSIDLFNNFASEFARLFSADPTNNWNEAFEVLGFVLGFAPKFLRGRRKPSQEAHAAARSFCEALDEDRIAKAFASPSELWNRTNFPEFLSFLGEVSPRFLRGVIGAMDLTEFERRLLALTNPSDAVFYVTLAVWEQRPDDVNPILERVAASMTRLSPYFALMSPELAFGAMRRGVPLDLGLQHHRWAFAAAVASRMAEVDRDLTAELLESNLMTMVEGLAGNFSDPFEGLSKWIAVADVVDSTYVDRVLSALPEGAVSRWSRAIRRPKRHGHARRREIIPLVSRARDMRGHVGRESEELLRQFPALAAEIARSSA